ncbi:MAG: hypothetical protein K6B52_07280, partial [Clostridiales bacterium]|nr:hypothetical protein [Clostridiales bacterium]
MNNKKKLIAAIVLVASMILLILAYFAFGGRLKSTYYGQKEAGVSSQNDKNADNENDESEDDNQSTGIFSIVNHKSNKITTDESVIAFSGTSNPVSSLTCNGNEVRRESNGDFSVEFDLTPGINTFLFKHGDEEYEYTVDYSVKLIKDASPAGEMTLPGGMQVEVSATALRGCDIYIVFGGTEYRMKQAQGNTDEDSSVIRNSKDFTTYIGSFVIPASKKDAQNLGPFVIKASAGGFNEEVKGANIKVNAVTSYYHEKASSSPRTEDEDETTLRETTAAYRLTKYRRETTLKQSTTVNALRASRRAAFAGTRPVSTILSTDENGNIITLLPETTQPEATTQSTTQATTLPSRLKKYSSSTDYGLGSAKICTMIRDYVEIFPGNTTSTYSDPDYSPLIKDTQDYVTGIAKYDGDTYYILSCGAKVPLSYEDNNGKGSKTKVTDVAVTEGYIMPPNTIRLVSCDSNDGEAVMKLDLNRKVPFIARLTGQSYSDYKVGRKVAVSECNATGLQIVFYDTVSAKGSFSFTDTIIRNASFSVKNKTATLSIDFKAAGRFYGYHYEYDKDGYLILSF